MRLDIDIGALGEQDLPIRCFVAQSAGDVHDATDGIRTDGWLLKATCRQNNGGWRNTALDMRGCDRSVVNDDGRLRCGGSGGSSNIPRGSYARSCTDIRVRNGMLRCDCRRIGGGMTP